MPPPPPPPRAPTALIIGASGFLGSAIANAFQRTEPQPFRSYGLIRRPSAAASLAAAEITPILGGALSDRSALLASIQSQSDTVLWDVIVVSISSSRGGGAEVEAQHWDDVLALVQGLSKTSAAGGVRPLVLWSSGCKDYGFTALDGDPDLAPHTETSPLVRHPLIKGRLEAALRVLDVAKADGSDFDAIVVRATSVYGYSSSYYGAILTYAQAYADAEGAGGREALRFTVDKRTVLHALHVDDCAEGYVSLATAAVFGGAEKRAEVVGEVFNISARRYETLEEVGTALAREYGFQTAEFGVQDGEVPSVVAGMGYKFLLAWSQWVGSDKIRRVTGWRDRRPLFSENLHVYRAAYEAAAEAGVESVGKIRERIGGTRGMDS
ncbi:hypothetical protein B0T19DRAFT_429654 [Cercophora scortea]|uniref:NAD-dependent epimerase/dehydratase domain-containing protein n=1 Tax=Cercophora scortea TaxID=314031 RepID=A0AAE0I8X3_9PEZI|nr:hypothetical protein B0T19DRAFT_429654 [Cercophora scortea]